MSNGGCVGKMEEKEREMKEFVLRKNAEDKISAVIFTSFSSLFLFLCCLYFITFYSIWISVSNPISRHRLFLCKYLIHAETETKNKRQERRRRNARERYLVSSQQSPYTFVFVRIGLLTDCELIEP